MKKKETKAVFKPYVMGQPSLMPPDLEEMIPADHLVRVVNEAIERIDLSSILARYKGGGTSSYHPKMMLKALVYAYSQGIFSSRQIAKALRENVYFMWISGQNRPDFRTINRFRGEVMKGIIQEVFAATLDILIEAGYVKLEKYFVDGTTMEANAPRPEPSGSDPNGTYLSKKPMIFTFVGKGRMTGGSFSEVNRRRRSRRGIRYSFPQSSDRSRTMDASVFCFTPARVLA